MATSVDRSSLTPVISTDQKQRIVVVAVDAVDLEPVVKQLRGLVLAGHHVTLLWWRGTPGPRLASFKARVQIAEPQVRGLRRRLRQIRDRVAGAPGTGQRALKFVAALRRDPRATRALERADAVIPAGRQAWEYVDDLTAPGRPAVSGQELEQWEAVAGVWRKLETQVALGRSALTTRYLHSFLRHVQLLGGRVPAPQQPLLVPVVEGLHHLGRYELARDVADLLDPDEAGLDPVHGAERAGWRTLARTSAAGVPDPSIHEVARCTVEAADTALRRDDVDRAVGLVDLTLRLLFHRELHADGLSSPLVDDPDDFLAPWRGSEVGRLLARRVRQLPARASGGRASGRRGDGRPRVVVVPGTYSQFATPVIEALTERADVRIVDLSARPDLRGLGPRRAPVDTRLRQALGEPVQLDYEVLEEMEAATAVFVDWADPGALATVMALPQGVPLTLRMHSMDALSPWVHLIDWSRVDNLVLVSEPIRLLMERLLGDRLSGTRISVVPNVVDLSRVPVGKTEGHLRRLLMVGWGMQVKDPLWALEVLSRLRAADPSWRLSLLGTDFPADPVRSQRAYARQFRARLTEDDVRDAVDIEGYTRDISPHLAAAGFVLSASRRESFGLGLVEAAASGAVPVVRDWPVFASLGAARSLFPAQWVVETVEEAAERIRAASVEPAWSQASHEARSVVQERFSSGDARTTLQDLVLGVP